MMKRHLPFLLAFAIFLLAADQACASSGLERFWVGFKNFWGRLFASLGGIVGIVLLTGVVAIFIITRGKWMK